MKNKEKNPCRRCQKNFLHEMEIYNPYSIYYDNDDAFFKTEEGQIIGCYDCFANINKTVRNGRLYPEIEGEPKSVTINNNQNKTEETNG